MNRRELVREIERRAKRRRVATTVDFKGGLGLHCRVTVEDRNTTIAPGEISPRLVDVILTQLRLNE